MPSPVGHVIAGVTAGWLVAGAPLGVHKFWKKEKIRQKVAGTFPGKVPATFEKFGWEAAVFGALGACPDIDLLFGSHRGPTHSIAAALVVGFVVAIWAGIWTVIRAGGARRPLTFAVACAAAYASHLLLDWLGRDSSPPIGIMAFWPVSRDYFESALHVFMPISRRYYPAWVFVRDSTIALVMELMILVPLLVLTILFRSRSGSR